MLSPSEVIEQEVTALTAQIQDIERSEAPPASLVEEAHAYVVASPESYVIAAERKKTLKSKLKKILEKFAPLKASTHDAHRKACKLEYDATSPLEQAAEIYGEKTTRYDEEQARIAEEETKRIAELAAKAEDDRRLSDASHVVATGGSQEEALAVLEEPAFLTPAVVQKATPAVQGISYRLDYDAAVVDPMKLIRHVAMHPELVNLIAFNASALRSTAKAQKEAMNLPGVKLIVKKIQTTRTT